MDLLNENSLNEATYSVTVDLMGPMKVQVRAKDEKEAKKIVASKLQRGMRDVKGVKKISEVGEWNCPGWPYLGWLKSLYNLDDKYMLNED